MAWFEKELASSGEDWKIPYFHHPLYSSGETPRVALRHCDGARAALPAVQRQRRLHRPRSLLRADQAAEGDHPLRRRLGRQAAARRHRPEDRPDGGRLRYRSWRFLVAEIDGDRALLQRRSRSGPAAIIDSGVSSSRRRKRGSGSSHLRDLAAAASAHGRCFEHSVGRSSSPDPAVVHDDADLAPAVELELAQALAADERRRAVADDGADVQAQARSFARLDAARRLVEPADDADLDAGLAPAPRAGAASGRRTS